MSGKDSNLHGTRRPRGYGPVPYLVGVRSVDGLAGRIRTCGFLVPNEARSPLRYSESEMVETMGFEPISLACEANALPVERRPLGVPGRV